MRKWTDAFVLPAARDEKSVTDWLKHLAWQLCNGASLVVAGEPHRITEIEFYLTGPGHEDPFAHAHEVQAHLGRWYFHRIGQSYRGGTYKGVDLTIGDGTSRGGILIRGLESATGDWIEGPSKVVDHLLARTGIATVAELDRRSAKGPAWQYGKPFYLRKRPETLHHILATARVGLTLNRMAEHATMPDFLLRPYRFLTDPERTSNGKTQSILAWHRYGFIEPLEIMKRTGSTLHAVNRCIAAYEAGRREGTFADFIGKTLTPADHCRMQGIADR